ncbi:hypothetical protein ACQKF0_30020 [Bacillus wiedmannii]|uniref:hypothetical protein n=1 Tax=Bacillus cereus group TaxID=86661 RepID=UPI001C03705A|nr:hypothetical protein [Bacillus mycoides]QWI52545.1 hypothetical protein EXW56_27195 [Bacillus mycoides]
MSYKYESNIHYFNVCMKFLKKNGIGLDSQERAELKMMTDKVFRFNEDYTDVIYRLELREPTRILTYLLNSSTTGEEFEENIDYYKFVHNLYLEAVTTDELNDEAKDYLYANYYKGITPQKRVYLPKDKGFREYTDAFIKLQKDLAKRAGIYFLYDENRELIYIGKSTSNLGERIPSSIKERQASCFSYTLTETVSDAHIYEMYYITTLKPKLNTDGQTNDLPTVKLPDLEFTGIQKAFKDGVMEVSLNG